MADDKTSMQCLQLLCPAVAEERVLDALLAIEGTGIFVSTPAAAHGLAHARLSAEEQVVGRSAAALVQVLVASSHLDALLAQLHPELAHTGVRYWVTPMTRQGEFL